MGRAAFALVSDFLFFILFFNIFKCGAPLSTPRPLINFKSQALPPQKGDSSTKKRLTFQLGMIGAFQTH